MTFPAESLAEILAAARRDGRLVTGVDPALVPPDHDGGYRAAAEVELRLGWKRAGWKVAATNEDTQRRLRSHEPIHGPVFAQFVRESGETLALGSLLTPLVECEFAFEFARDLPVRDGPYGRTDIEEAIACARAAIEVAECRFPDAHLPAVPGVLADHAGSGHLILGERVEDWRELALPSVGVTLLVDGREKRRGSGADILGDPVNVLVWLANRRMSLGAPLKAGDLVSTGTATGMVRPRVGETHLADFGPLGRVEVRFEP